MKVVPFTLINCFLYKLGPDEILKMCALEHERDDIIQEVHAGPTRGFFTQIQQPKKYCKQVYGGIHYIKIVKIK